MPASLWKSILDLLDYEDCVNCVMASNFFRKLFDQAHAIPLQPSPMNQHYVDKLSTGWFMRSSWGVYEVTSFDDRAPLPTPAATDSHLAAEYLKDNIMEELMRLGNCLNHFETRWLDIPTSTAYKAEDPAKRQPNQPAPATPSPPFHFSFIATSEDFSTVCFACPHPNPQHYGTYALVALDTGTGKKAQCISHRGWLASYFNQEASWIAPDNNAVAIVPRPQNWQTPVKEVMVAVGLQNLIRSGKNLLFESHRLPVPDSASVQSLSFWGDTKYMIRLATYCSDYSMRGWLLRKGMAPLPLFELPVFSPTFNTYPIERCLQSEVLVCKNGAFILVAVEAIIAGQSFILCNAFLRARGLRLAWIATDVRKKDSCDRSHLEKAVIRALDGLHPQLWLPSLAEVVRPRVAYEVFSEFPARDADRQRALLLTIQHWDMRCMANQIKTCTVSRDEESGRVAISSSRQYI
eukprot:tig00020902_g15022.t1